MSERQHRKIVAAVEALCRSFIAADLPLSGMMTFCHAVTMITVHKAPLVDGDEPMKIAFKIHKDVAEALGYSVEEVPSPNDDLTAHIEQTVVDLQATMSTKH